LSGNVTLSGGPQLEHRLAAISRAPGRTIGQKWALLTTRYAKLDVARKTGNTGRSIHPGPISETAASVIAGGASEFLEFGTKPHEILPRRRKALRFAAAGSGAPRLSGRPRKGQAVTFAKRVRHPGTRPQPFLGPAARRALKESGIEGSIVEEWNGAA
jgi:hypothetical protein